MPLDLPPSALRYVARTAVIIIAAMGMCLIAQHAAFGQSQTDIDTITKVALDYGEGWYEADAERMERALHPELAKRMVLTNPATGKSRLSQQGALTLINNTRRGGGKDAPIEDFHSEVTIFEIYENAATAKVEGPEWTDYLHLAKWNGRWVIVNVLWELKPATRDRMLGRR